MNFLKLKKLLCVFLCLNLLTINLTFAKESNEMTPAQAITESIIVFNTTMDLGEGHEKALQEMVAVLSKHQISTDQLKAYVLESSDLTESKKETYIELLAEAETNEFDKMDPAILGSLMGETLNLYNPQGLSWSGCASLGVGIAALVAAVVVGIVAIVKSAGEERITKRYTRKKNARTADHNARMDWLEDPIASIDSDIAYSQGRIRHYDRQIDDAYDDIRYYHDRAQDSDDPDYWLNKIDNRYDDIDDYNRYIRDHQRKIDRLLVERVKYATDPTYVIKQRNAEISDYNSDISSLNAEMARQIDLIPKNQKLAKGLGIASGVGLAIGGYFLYDGIKKKCY